MKRNLLRFAWLVLASLWLTPGAFSIELKGAPSTVATATSAASSVRAGSSQSGTVVKIDGKSGELVLDGARRFTFTPGGGLIVRQSNGTRANLAAVKAGTRVKLSVFGNSGYASAVVSELLIVE